MRSWGILSYLKLPLYELARKGHSCCRPNQVWMTLPILPSSVTCTRCGPDALGQGSTEILGPLGFQMGLVPRKGASWHFGEDLPHAEGLGRG